MYNSLNDRAICFAKYIILTKSTIRQTAKVFDVSKSTVHNDVSYKLKKINYLLYESVHKILQDNFSQKHLRGGEATKIKYSQKKDIK